MTQDTMEVQRPKRPRKRVRPNRKAQDQRIILMWIKRIGIGIMVLLLLGQEMCIRDRYFTTQPYVTNGTIQNYFWTTLGLVDFKKAYK